MMMHSNDNKIRTDEERQQRKMHNLILEENISSNNPDDVIFNYSSHQLSEDEKRILALGLNFSIPPQKLNYASYFSS